MSEGENSAFLPQSTRCRLLQRGLSFKPHAMIAIGDHVYWDQRTWLESSTAGIREFSSGLYKAVGMLDRGAPAYGGTNEEILKIVAGEQITPLYGTTLRSTPSYFINDDHDYFENDDAENGYGCHNNTDQILWIYLDSYTLKTEIEKTPDTPILNNHPS